MSEITYDTSDAILTFFRNNKEVTIGEICTYMNSCKDGLHYTIKGTQISGEPLPIEMSIVPEDEYLPIIRDLNKRFEHIYIDVLLNQSDKPYVEEMMSLMRKSLRDFDLRPSKKDILMRIIHQNCVDFFNKGEKEEELSISKHPPLDPLPSPYSPCPKCGLGLIIVEGTGICPNHHVYTLSETTKSSGISSSSKENGGSNG